MTRRARPVGWVGALGLVIGLLGPGLRGCVDCEEESPPAEAYVVTRYPDSQWVEGSARVEVSDDALTVTYDTKDGTKWKAVYRKMEE